MSRRRRVCAATIALLTAPALVRAQSASVPPVAAEGDRVLDRVRAAWPAPHDPLLLDYDIVVEAAAGSSARRDRYHGEVDTASGDFRVRPFSDTEDRQPAVPHGTNLTYQVSISLQSGRQPVTGGGGAGIGGGGTLTRVAPPEAFAIPDLSPLYAFGMRPCASVADRAADASGLRTIGSVATVRRRYRASVIGTERVDDGPALHLALTPLVDPARDRVRDLWVDPVTYAPLAARVAGNFTGRAERAVSWFIRFATVDGASAIATETAESPVMRGRTRYDRVVVRFENVAPRRGPASLAFALSDADAGLNTIEEPPDCTARQGRSARDRQAPAGE